MKDKIREIASIQADLDQHKHDLAATKDQLDKSEIEKKEVTRYAQDLVEKVKKDSEQQEFMIDRRLINTFLINYANPMSSKDTKMQMLDAMSKILGFSLEEK
jgi:septal ring factor EnvC (AmiA/AmiB activator)